MREPVTEHVGKWLSAYYDGELSGERLAQVKAHLVSCEACRADLKEIKSLSLRLESSPLPTRRVSHERFTSQVMLRLPHAPERPMSSRVLTGFWKAAPLVAITGWAFLEAVLLVAQGVLVMYGQRLPAPNPGALMSVLSSLNVWTGVLLPVIEVFALEFVLTGLVVAFLWGWLASWWAMKKI